LEIFEEEEGKILGVKNVRGRNGKVPKDYSNRNPQVLTYICPREFM